MSAVAMQSFGFGEQLVRAVDRNGSAWFVGNDVCAALEIGNGPHAIGRLEDDERDAICIADAIGRVQSTAIISESGVYALVFTSRKEAAKRFRRWVTQEVLPSLRRTGRYELAPCSNEEVASPALDLPDEHDALRTKLAIAREARIVFGVRAARKAWQAMDLLPALTEGLEAERSLPDFGSGVIADVHRTVVDWINMRCAHEPGHRVPSMVLYKDYVDWGVREGVSQNELLSVTGFGRALSNLGIAVKKTDRMHRVGLRLVA